jgi:uncharacterized membrane protein YbhN (UPF0104 family)
MAASRGCSACALAVVLLTLGVRRASKHPELVEPLLRTPPALLNRLRRNPVPDNSERVRGFLEQLRAARLRPGHGAAAAAYALLSWLLDAACLWLCFGAVGEPPAGLTEVLLAFCSGMAAGTITIVPGGLGIVDSTLVLGLIAGGVATTTAVAVVLLHRIISLGFIMALGWTSWFRIRRRPSGRGISVRR